MNNIIDGKKVSEKIKLRLIDEISYLDNKPGMAVISVGNDPASKIYVSKKCVMATELGINFKHFNYDEGISEEELINKITELNIDNSINGIIVQLPLPKYLDSKKIINKIDPSKDIDGLTILNQGKLMNNEECLIPCTPKGVIKLLEEYNIQVEGKSVVIIGRSNLVGKPLFHLLLNKNATVTMCHAKTVDLASYTNNADILISAVGKKSLIKSDMIKDSAVVIDVGINRIDGKIYGDVDNSVYSKVKYITPVPGGVGPMTVIMLMENLLLSYKNGNRY